MTSDERMAITTSARADEALCRRATTLACELNCAYLPRPEGPLDDAISAQRLAALVVVGRFDIVVHTPHAQLRHHPNAAVLRVVNMLRGRSDTLVDLAQLAPGDALLDCTCGIGSDAIAVAHAVGATGRVQALEASPLLAMLARCGMQSYRHPTHHAVTEAMRRVQVETACYRTMLPTLADRSFDVVYFDPMFSHTVAASNGLDVVRSFARQGLPEPRDIDHAQRVARRCILMKDGALGHALEALGFATVKRNRRFCYGRIDCTE